ncbi:kinase-like protein [Penicillium malachiteum]|uniref:Kinase-like protein n=1 Tax=Penicillium malachiteum TaxID=1324776 RepID=A0AAD6HH14_9EURO|nr:kinase-like protein [Penicillium malachiteum]
MAQELEIPEHGGETIRVLCDFGSAVHGDQCHTTFIQPEIYRAPEVILGPSWTFSVAIWNMGYLGLNEDHSGDFLNPDLLTGLIPLEQRETTLEGQAERDAFLLSMQKMLQWEPDKLSSANELLEDEWILSYS